MTIKKQKAMNKKKRAQRKTTSLLLCLLLLALCLSGCDLSSLSRDTTKDSARQGGRTDTELQIIPVEEAARQQTVTQEEVQEASLPSFWDGRLLGRSPKMQNQGNLGTCWAFAALGALDANLLPEEVHFSADHMAANNGYGIKIEEGGNAAIALAYLASWKGPVLEEDDPYGDGKTAPDAPARYHLQQAEYLSGDITAIKEAIQRYGAVTASIYADDGILSTGKSTAYYDAGNAAYYYTGNNIPNHDVIIVGWDDHFDARKFTSTPPKDGAFICQNSWGSEFGDNGYFYISYYDTTVLTHVLCYERLDEIGVYREIYQYDLVSYSVQIGYQSSTAWGANVFTAQSDGELAAVSVFSVIPESKVEIFIKKISAGSTEEEVIAQLSVNEATETPNAKQTLPRAGYYTIDLPDAIPLKEGEMFAVIVKIHSDMSLSPLAADASETPKEAGKSFISGDGSRWLDAGSEYQCMVCIKAFVR